MVMEKALPHLPEEVVKHIEELAGIYRQPPIPPPIPPPSSPVGDLYSMEVPRMETRLMKKERIIAEDFWRSLMEGLDRPPYNLPPTSS